MSQDRRDFLKHVGSGAAAVAAVSAVAAAQEAKAADSSFKVLAAAGGSQIKISLDLDGAFAGWIQSVEGGSAVAEVITEETADGVAKKRLGKVKYEDISVTCDFSMGKALYEWIKASFDGKEIRKSGAIAVADYKYDVTSILGFQNALITEVGFPACDATSKEPAYMTLKFAPELTRNKKGSGVVKGSFGTTQKAWLPCNFRFTIDGMEKACSRVNKIESLTLKQATAPDPKDDKRVPRKLEIPPLKCEILANDADPFFAWHEDFVIKGNNGDDKELNGSLEFLDTNQETMFKLEIGACGPSRCAHDKCEAGGEGIRRVKMEMYCEQMKMGHGI
jgi:hypothetical protein